MRSYIRFPILPAGAAGLALMLATAAQAAPPECQGRDCPKPERAQPARPAPPANRPPAPPAGQHPSTGPNQPAYPHGGAAPQQGYRPNGGAPPQNYRPNGAAPQQTYRPNGVAPQGYQSKTVPNRPYGGPGGPGPYAHGGGGRAPAYSTTRRFTYQGRSFAAVRVAPYRYPHGYAYRAYHPHDRFPFALLIAPYFITDFGIYNLPPPGPSLQWVRYGPDALLVDTNTGDVVDVAYGVFEEDPGYQADGGYGGYDPSSGYPPPPPPGYGQQPYNGGGYPPPNVPPQGYGYPPPDGPQG